MHFRVSAIQDEGLPESWNAAQQWLEDWLNSSLHDADFGGSAGQIMILVLCTETLPKAPAPSRLTKNAGGHPLLTLHVGVEPERVHAASPDQHLRILCSAITTRLPQRVLRKPAGLDYERLRLAIQACARPLAQGLA